jgi:hypothetical protein
MIVTLLLKETVSPLEFYKWANRYQMECYDKERCLTDGVWWGYCQNFQLDMLAEMPEIQKIVKVEPGGTWKGLTTSKHDTA